MNRLSVRVAAAAAAGALLTAGIGGAYSYAQDYNLHRGFTPVPQLRGARSGRLEQIQFYSPALHRVADYLVYLPPGYSPSSHYPVYYLLHGSPGQPRQWVDIAHLGTRLNNQLSLGHVQPMILVYPDGRIRGSSFSDSQWANTRAGSFEDYVLDVVADVDQRFATIPLRQDRVIAGLSSGGYGAMNIALHHLSVFANVQSWSGYFIQTRSGVFAHATPSMLAYNSPLEYISRLARQGAFRTYPLRVFMYVGHFDSDRDQQLPMARALRDAGAQVQYRFYRGGHNWSVWVPHLDQMLRLASRDMGRPPNYETSRALPVLPPPKLAQLVRHRPRTAGHRRRRGELGLIGALLLGLLSAALINLGFVLQHRGHDRASQRGGTSIASGLREPVWLLGQVTGWVGFVGQIVAVALAPLTLVQAFSAGSLALSVPLAARILGYRVTRNQLIPIAVIALSLGSLPLGFDSAHGHLRPGVLIVCALLVMLAGGLLSARHGAVALAVTAGAFYGTADAAIKAAATALRFHGNGVLTGWTVLACLCTLGGFIAFQAALRRGDAVVPLSLMNAFTAIVGIGLGIVAFSEQLGTDIPATVLHGLAIVAVLGCVRPLTDAQLRLARSASRDDSTGAGSTPTSDLRAIAWRRALQPRTMVLGVGGSLLRLAAIMIGALAALGLLYELRQTRLFAVGPRVPDALPLLQLAGFDAQPLTRLLVATLPAGLVLGWALIGLDRRRRVVLAGVLSLLLLLAGSDASYALTRNLRFGQVLLNRSPGLGAWLEAVVLTLGSALAGPIATNGLPALTLPHRSRPAWRRA
jgi:enterochelin esterase-like enzyme